MADIASLIQNYLSTSAKPKRLNFYTLLDLDELIDDRTAIALAVESAIEKLKAADRKRDPAGFEQVVKVVRQARSTLLDEEKKRVYDQQLKSTIAKQSLPSSTSDRPLSESVRLTMFLPTGDPSAPFSMSEFLKVPVVAPEIETAAQRHIALAELENASQEAKSNNTHPSSGTNGVRQFSNADRFAPASERPVGSRSTGRELQEMIRRNRKKKNIMAASVAIGGSFIVVLIGATMFIRNRWELQRQNAENDKQIAMAGANPSMPGTPSSANAGQLPSQGNSEKRMNLGIVSKGNTERVGTLPKLDEVGEPAAKMPDNAEKNLSPSKPAPSNPAPPNPAPSEPAPPEPMKTTEPIAEPKMADEPPKSPAMSEDDSKWRESMNSARQAIAKKEFEKFGVEIEKTLGLSVTDAQQEQCNRLDKFGQLYQQAFEILNESMIALKSQEEIRYGSTGKAAIVELKSHEIILRIAGKNETYQFDKLPMGIVMAVIEPRVKDSANEQVIRGILYGADAKNNPASKKKAKEYFDKAASMDKTLTKLDELLEEIQK